MANREAPAFASCSARWWQRLEPFTIISNQTKTGAYYGFYLQDEWKVFEPLTINFGARFDIVDEFAQQIS